MISLYCRRRWFIFRATLVLLFLLLTAPSSGICNQITADYDSEDLNQTISSRITRLNALNKAEHSHDDNSKQLGAFYHRNNARSRIGIEEEEAMVFESLCFSASSALKSSIRFTAIAIRRTGDTIAGVLSVTLKTVAGAFKLSADAFWITAMQLAQPRAPDDRMPHLFDHAGRRVAKVLRAVANVFYGLSEASIMAGEATQALAIGLGQAVEDSFSSLEFLCSSLQKSFTFLLRTEENSFNVKEDSFHQRKRLAVLHTEVSQKHQTMPLKFGKPVHLSSSDLRGLLSRNKQTNSTDSTDTVTRLSNEINMSAIDVSLGNINFGEGVEVGVEVGMDDDMDDDWINKRSAHPSSPPPFWSFFAHAENNTKKQNHARKSDNSFDIKSKVNTITGYLKRAYSHPPSDVLEYFDSVPSVFLLFFHVFRSWITGPWSHQIHGFLRLFSINSTSSSTSTSTSTSETHDDITPGPPKLGPQLLFSLIMITILSNLKFKSIIWKLSFMICLILAVWMTLMASDHVNRKILTTRVSIQAIDSLMKKRVMMSSIPSLLSIPVQTSHTNNMPINDHENISKSGPNNNNNNNNDNNDNNGHINLKKEKADYERKEGDGNNKYPFNSKINDYHEFEEEKSSDDDKDNFNYFKNDINKEQDGNNNGNNSSNNSSSSTSDALDFEVAVWLNVMMSSLWNVERTGGLGPYISRTIQDLVNDELSLVPPGIANIQLKRLTLGTQPPIVQSIKIHSRRASICITPAKESTPKVPSRLGDMYESSTKSMESESTSETRTVDKGVHAAVTSSKPVHADLVKGDEGAIDARTDRDRDGDRDGDGDLGPQNRRNSNSNSKGMEWSQWEEWQLEWDKRHVGHPTATMASAPSTTTPSTTSSSSTSAQQPPLPQRSWTHRTGTGSGSGSGRAGSRGSSISRRPGGGSGCERLVLDLDVTYVSRDMDIVLTLRSSDVRSVLPEATVTLSGVVLSGVLRLDGELTPDYPFFGNATVRTFNKAVNELSQILK